MLNMVVLHFADGTIRKGTTDDFFPNKEMFHLKERDGGSIRDVRLSDLKAVYFVKSFEGDPAYKERDDQERAGFGKRIRVLFRDSEVLIGYTQGFTPDRSGFFVFPADPCCNNDRVFVVNAATEQVNFM